MQQVYHPAGGPWRRDYLPRTALVFIDNDPTLSSAGQCQRAKERASATLAVYWKAMQGTVSAEKIDEELNNALWGNPEQIVEQIQQRYHRDDRLMCWFDFCCHDNELVTRQMRIFMEKVVAKL